VVVVEEALSADKEEEDAEEELCGRECGPGIQVLEEEEDRTSMRVKRPTNACKETH
jgi:hypothetical protein